MSLETIFQSSILVDFLYPFLLIFFILFALLEKTKILGEQNTQIDALVSFIASLLFMGFAIQSRSLLSNLVSFLVIALIIIFVIYLLFGFISGNSSFKFNKWIQISLGALVFVGLVIFLLSVTKTFSPLREGISELFSSISSGFWTNLIIIVLVAAALAAVLKSPVSLPKK